MCLPFFMGRGELAAIAPVPNPWLLCLINLLQCFAPEFGPARLCGLTQIFI